MDFGNFKPFTLTSGPSTMTVSKSGVSFSRTSVIKLNKTRYARLLIDYKDKMVAVQEAEKDDENAVPFYNPKRKIITARWNYVDLINSIANLMDWNIKKHTYRINGEYIEAQKALVFDLKEPNILNK